MKYDKKEDIISLEIVTENSVKFERLEKFSESYFRNAYYQAFVNTGQLIEQNKNYGGKVHSWEYERMYNIIPFWGPRGIGKTSVMRSFVGALDAFNPDAYNDFFTFCKNTNNARHMPSAAELNNCEFICLECIDAAFLVGTEDIFQVILARMLQQILEKGHSLPGCKEWAVMEDSRYVRYRKADIYAMFQEIYTNLGNLQKNSSYKSGAGAVEMLKELSGSLDLRETFQKMVPVYLHIMAKSEREDKKRFLVISIDDLDMHKSGYDVLEQIYRYFSVPNVLIYITVSGSELLTLSNRHFRVGKEDEAEEKRRKDLANAYIDKVLPFSNRVYLPELIWNSERIVLKSNRFSIKKTLLWKIARRTKVYFDGCGKKVHFYEADDMRTLVNTWALLNNMDVLKEESFFSEYQLNLSNLLADVTNRLADYKLTGSQREVFREICKMNSSRHGIAFVSYVVSSIKEGEFTSAYAEHGYNYGEFLRAIYILGRDRTEDKPLVHCMLALETVCLTNLYETSLCEQACYPDDSKENAKNQLLSAISGSISGSWGAGFVPRLVAENQKKNKKFIKWAYCHGNLENREFAHCPIKSSTFETVSDIKALIEKKNGQIVKMLELFFLFLAKHQCISEGGSIQIELQKQGVSGEKPADGSFKAAYEEKLVWSLNSCRVTFDILGIVVNSMSYRKVLGKVQDAILDAIVQYCTSKKISLTKRQKESLGVSILKASLLQDFRDWEEKYGSYCPMPVYSTDIMYNVLKRVKKKCDTEGALSIHSGELLEAISTMLSNIRDELEKEDTFYNYTPQEDENATNKGKKCDSHFSEIFSECPPVKMLLNKEYTKDFKVFLEKFIEELSTQETILALDQPVDMEEL